MNLKSSPEKMVVNLLRNQVVNLTGLCNYDGNGVMDFAILDDKTTYIDAKIYKYVTGSPSLVLIASGTIPFNGNTTLKLLNQIGMGDYNGDGKGDFTYLNVAKTEMYIAYSNGVGFSAPKKIDVFTALTASVTDYVISSPDINSDGKNDIVITNNLDHTGSTFDNYFSYYSNGDLFSKGPSAKGKWVQFEQWKLHYPSYHHPLSNNTPYWVKVNASVFMHSFDLTGDGIYDAISIKDYPNQKIMNNYISSTKADYIKQIITGYGKKITIKYANTGTEYNVDKKQIYGYTGLTTYTHPLVKNKPTKFVVDRVTYNSTFIPVGSTDPAIENAQRYIYFDAVHHKEGRGFLGFEKTIMFDVNTEIAIESTNEFTTSFYLALNKESVTGKIQYTIAGGGITKYSLNTNKIASRVKNTYILTLAPGNISFFARPQTVTAKDYMNSTGSVTTYAYDMFKAGNVTSIIKDFKWSAGDQPERTETTTMNYALAGPTGKKNYKLSDVTVSQTQKNATGNYNRTTVYNYHATSGHLTQISQDPTFGSQNLLIDLPDADYNAVGLPTRVNISAGDVIPGPRTAQVQYDAKSRFVIKTINALNHTNEFVYEPVYGNVVQSKDNTGLVSTYKYDGMGRLIETTTPSGVIDKVKYTYVVPAYSPSSKNSVYSITSLPEGKAYSKGYFDSYDRPTRKEGLDLNNNTVVADNTYDGAGRLVASTEPYKASQTIYLINKYIYETDFFRMSTENVVASNNQSTNLFSTGYTYNGLSNDVNRQSPYVDISGRSGHEVKKWQNVAGQTTTVQTMVENPNLVQNSVYTYTNNGQPAQVDLSYGYNNWVPSVTHKFGYNTLGQQTSLIDPSLGTITYAYNTLGELLTQTDANGSYTFTYDILGRLQQKAGNLAGTTSYQYVSAGNGLGQIEKIIGPNVTNDLQYDNLNRITQYKETQAGNKIFTNDFVYDKYNRIIQNKYPSGYTTKNTYNAQGYLTQIKNANNNLLWQLDDANSTDQIT